MDQLKQVPTPIEEASNLAYHSILSETYRGLFLKCKLEQAKLLELAVRERNGGQTKSDSRSLFEEHEIEMLRKSADRAPMLSSVIQDHILKMISGTPGLDHQVKIQQKAELNQAQMMSAQEVHTKTFGYKNDADYGIEDDSRYGFGNDFEQEEYDLPDGLFYEDMSDPYYIPKSNQHHAQRVQTLAARVARQTHLNSITQGQLQQHLSTGCRPAVGMSAQAIANTLGNNKYGRSSLLSGVDDFSL